MSVIQVTGLVPLEGEISVQGSKNAVLPMMAAALLHQGLTVLSGVPEIEDVACMISILEHLGCSCRREGDTLLLDARELSCFEIPERFVSAMRSSIILLGPLLGRLGRAESGYPGGCLIGARPIDLHLAALRSLGAKIEETDGRIVASCGRLRGAQIRFPFPSVGATEQALLAAVLAEGVTIIRGAAREPEIAELCGLLNHMGGVVCGAGTDCLMVQGVRQLHDASVRVGGDRIVAGTYAAAAAIAGGRVSLRGIRPSLLAAPLDLLEKMGVKTRRDEEGERLEIAMRGRPRAVDLATGPYPAFPTDLQSPFMALLAAGDGCAHIDERVFEGRFATADALLLMGAEIRRSGRRALVRGRYPLRGARVEASDLRGGAALVIAALAAEGRSEIGSCHHIRRGYEDICRDLGALGAHICWREETRERENV